MLEGMIKRGLIAERPARDGELAWAHSDDEFGLEITLKGRALVGSTDQEPSSREDQPPEPATPREGANARNSESDARSNARPAFRPGTKQALLIDLLRRPEAVTITEVQESTGWQPHTARAAITGLKKTSLRVSSAMRGDQTRAYRVIPNTDNSEKPG